LRLLSNRAGGGLHQRCQIVSAIGVANLKTTITQQPHKRNFSSTSSVRGSLCSISTDETDPKIRTLTLNRPPVNSLSLEFLQELIGAIDELEAEAKEVELSGVIIQSSSKSVFSAGLDLQEMLKPDRARLTEFWSNLQEFWIRLYGCQLTVASAITGHAPAAGTLIACASDYRVMTSNPKLTIGLNETKFGLAAPSWLAGSFVSTIGQRQAEKALLDGTLFKPSEALAINLIDEVGEDAEDTLAKCRTHLARLGNNRASARALTKTLVRQNFIKDLRSKFDSDVEFYVDHIASEEFQHCVGTYLKSLQNKPKKK